MPIDNIEKVFTIRDTKIKNANDKFIVISQHESSIVLEQKQGLEEVDSSKTGFNFNEPTIGCIAVGTSSP